MGGRGRRARGRRAVSPRRLCGRPWASSPRWFSQPFFLTGGGGGLGGGSLHCSFVCRALFASRSRASSPSGRTPPCIRRAACVQSGGWLSLCRRGGGGGRRPPSPRASAAAAFDCVVRRVWCDPRRPVLVCAKRSTLAGSAPSHPAFGGYVNIPWEAAAALTAITVACRFGYQRCLWRLVDGDFRVFFRATLRVGHHGRWWPHLAFVDERRRPHQDQ